MLAADATSQADLTEARFKEMAADPIFGSQVSMPILMGMLALPDADVAEALVDKFRGLGRYYRELADRQREGVARGRLPAAFAVRDTVAQLDGLLSRPVADDPLLDDHARRRTGSTSTAGRPGCARRSSPTYAPGWRPTATSLRDEVLPARAGATSSAA